MPPALPCLAIVLLIVPAQATTATSEPPPAEPTGYRLDDYRKPTPATLRGAEVIESDRAAQLKASDGAIFIDVYPRAPKPPNLPAGTIWRDPVHESIPGAVWLPNVGYGALSETVAGFFRSQLERLTDGLKDKPVVFFCERACWMSWNAAKRAQEFGYTRVIWFPEGTNGWLDAGEELVRIEPVSTN